jgi:SPP1 gp7 family putative phage head morphogenesis protein
VKLGDIPPAAASFELPPEEALNLFRAKGLKPTFAWQDAAHGEHAHAFTVAKMMDVDLLSDVRKSLDQALLDGKPFAAWQKEITPLLQAKGWWGKKEVLDPVTGQMVTAQLGSAARLETIFRTNLQSSYAAGHWDQIQSQADQAPYLMYDAIDDDRTRTAHRAWDGTVLPIGSPWWAQHYPPCGWRCRCSVIQLAEDELDALGVKVTSPTPSTATAAWQNPRTGETLKIPLGVDPGFGRPPTSPLKVTADQLLHEKVQQLPQDLAASANLGIE